MTKVTENSPSHLIFDLEEAKNYWRFAPSGKGKLDTSWLIEQDDDAFLEIWQEHFDSRLHHYWEEARLMPYFARMFAGKKVLSFGSGLGLNETQFLERGADLTCADIVENNLRVIKRAANLKQLPSPKVIVMEDSSQCRFDEQYDFIYAYGSLMTMPFDQQKMVFNNFKKALKPDGRIILMLYTWKFVADTCGVDDPKIFALRSDPSVGDIHNPWSDWHDGDKVMQLAGLDMTISAQQLWNQDWYVWYGVDWAKNWNDLPQEFVKLNQESCVDKVLARPDRADFEKIESKSLEIGEGGQLFIETLHNQFLYAAWSEEFYIEKTDNQIEVMLDAELLVGGFSIGLMNIDDNSFTMSRVISWEGRHIYFFPIDAESISGSVRLVFSNFQEKQEAVSKFTIHDVAVVSSRFELNHIDSSHKSGNS